MKKILTLFILLYSTTLFGQEEQPEWDVSDLYTKIQLMINSASDALAEEVDCDPYGFQISIRVAAKDGGDVINVLDPDQIMPMVQNVIDTHNFGKFDLDVPVHPFVKGGFMYVSVGLMPQNVKDEGFLVSYHAYNFKKTTKKLASSATPVVRSFTAQISAQFVVAPPNDGKIEGSALYVNADGKETPLLPSSLKSPSGEKMLKYRRLGPGSKEPNSGNPDEPVKGWKYFSQYGATFEYGDLTPGHYFPQVKANGCIQRFDVPESLEESDEAVVKTEGQFDCLLPKEDQNILKTNPQSVKGSTVKDMTIRTKYSMANTVEGFILTPSQKIETWRDSDFIKKEEVQVLKGKQKVWIEPYGWTTNDPTFPRFVMATDGYYLFETVPSGVYIVYLDGQNERYQIVEVCNCDRETKKPKYPNMRYQQNLGTVGYQIELTYDYNHPKGKLGFTARWENVVIAFGTGPAPQKFSVGNAQGWDGIKKDSLGNVLDIYDNILQPPFIMLERPNQEIICTDIFKYHGPPQMLRNTGADRFWEEHVPIKYDFSADGLYSEVEIVEYDKDVMIDNLFAVKKGIYMTWNFSGLIKVEDSGEEMQYFKMEASETFDHLEKLQGDLVANPLTGVVDAKVPDVVVEQMKKGEDFRFSKTNGAATYTIKGTIPK